MVTVRAANGENTKRRTWAQPYISDGNYTTPHANETINTLQQPKRNHARTTGYYEPTTMILDHLASTPEEKRYSSSFLWTGTESMSTELRFRRLDALDSPSLSIVAVGSRACVGLIV
jgi:hypothetical protein